MKKLSFFILSLFVAVSLFAQNGKKVVYVENFSYTSKIGSSHVKGLRNKIIASLVETDRITVKDVNSEAGLEQLSQRQTADASTIDPSTIVMMKNLNANYLIQGHVTTLEGNRFTTDEGKVYYKGSIVFSLNIVDIETGTLVGSENYSYSGSGSGGFFSTGTGSTADEAISNTSGTLDTDMEKLVNKYFALQGTILELSGEKKGKATEVYIDLGSAHGMQKKQKFDVFVEREIAGRKSQKKIGEIEIEAVEGDDISRCKVNKGGEEIKSAVGEEQTITIKTVYRKGLLEF
ncbi:hypothetical protein D0T84_08685 [Dysgonomonas sp. 521]|uniref:hypothetical protein n=1 Tax=Dysgonomonas sp. 521 TaxID=2302932 RepID=UPI0013D4FACD|nr:hypothetical protein [Dysgonomonas sp. 521]NDV94991.1 hypothetical protein [Dysgonomonas sp. 521]